MQTRNAVERKNFANSRLAAKMTKNGKLVFMYVCMCKRIYNKNIQHDFTGLTKKQLCQMTVIELFA